MSEFEKKLNRTIYNGVTIHDEKFYLFSNLVSFFKDWRPPKPLVEVPQKLADFIEDRKGEFKLYGAFHEIAECNDTELSNWVFQKSDGQSLFARAWLDGYTVEKPKEKLYFVRLPGVQPIISYMHKSCSPGEVGYHKEYSSKRTDEVHFSCRYDKKYSGGWQRQFTEKEIKAIDERYWPFAVPVDEV